MNITKQSQLTENQKQAMMELAHICQERESLSIQLYPDLDEEEQLFYLHSDEQGHLISFLSLTFYEEECLVHAFTHPSHRKKGCFNLLFDQAYEENIGPAFLFTIVDNAKDALAVLNQLECERTETDYLLQYRIKGTEIMPSSVSLFPCREEESLIWLHQACFPEYPEDLSRSFVEEFISDEDAEGFIIQKNGQNVGLGFCMYQEDQVYLAGFGVLPPFRRQHIALDTLSTLSRQLSDDYSFLCVQISDVNEAALRLYQKFGFETVESVHTYLFE